MIHSVYFWIKEEAQGQKAEMEAALLELVKIGEIQAAHVGKPASTEERPVTDHSFDFSLVLTFASKEDHDIYQDHPDHHVFVNQCKAMWDKVIVYDSEALA